MATEARARPLYTQISPAHEGTPPVLVFRYHLLPGSESFLLAQGAALQGFRPCYAGIRVDSGVSMPNGSSTVLNPGGVRGRLAEAAFRWFGFAPTLADRIARIQPVLIHAHFGPDGALIMPMAGRLGIPLVVTFHGYDATMSDEYARRSFYLHRKYLRVRPELQRNGRLFLAVSDYVRDRLIAQGFPAERTVTHYVGIDLARFSPGSPSDRLPIVLFAGRLAAEKGARYLVEAMAAVQREHPGAQVVFLGDGPLRPQLEAQARSLGVTAQFLGWQPQEIVKQWMSLAAVFCVPSTMLPSGEAEGFGLAFAEAQAMELPVASFAVGGVPEAVAHGETGLLASDGDTAALVRNLLTLLRDPVLCRRYGAAGRSRVEARFDLTRQTAKLEALYNRALGATR